MSPAAVFGPVRVYRNNEDIIIDDTRHYAGGARIILQLIIVIMAYVGTYLIKILYKYYMIYDMPKYR